MNRQDLRHWIFGANIALSMLGRLIDHLYPDERRPRLGASGPECAVPDLDIGDNKKLDMACSIATT
jgi:hypothetical protein